MSEKKSSRKIEYIQELLRKVLNIMDPEGTSNSVIDYGSEQARKELQAKYPQCWIPVSTGQPVPLMVPVCNRSGAYDSRIIQFSSDFVKQLATRGDIADTEAEMIVIRLEKLGKKYTNEIPRSGMMGQKKGLTTRMFRNIKDHLNTIPK